MCSVRNPSYPVMPHMNAVVAITEETPSPTSGVRSLELFAGAGGLALGLHTAGFELQAAVEKDASATETLLINGKHPRKHTRGWEVCGKDVRDFDYEQFVGIDLLSAGAPCQPFSHGGHRRGSLDERNLFPEVIRALAEVQPQAFLIENVRGLLFRDMELYWERLLRELRAPSRHYFPTLYARRGRPKDEYKVFFRVLDAADFGLPQRRLRLFIVGLRPGLADDWRWPEPTHNRDALITALLEDDYWERHAVPAKIRNAVRESIGSPLQGRLDPKGKRWRTLRDLISALDAPTIDVKASTDKWHIYIPDARLYPKHSGSKLDWPAKTVKAGVHGCPGGEHIVVLDDGTHRYLTVRECALLQGFPKTYAFPTQRSLAMKQIGNAVPVPVATAVGKQLVEVLRHG